MKKKNKILKLCLELETKSICIDLELNNEGCEGTIDGATCYLPRFL